MVVPLPLVSVLFERGAFGSDDTAATALAVAIYGLGLPAFVLQKILQPLFFAREDTRSPFRYAVAGDGGQRRLAVGLAPVIGWIAAAIGTTLAGWAMVVAADARRAALGRCRRASTTGFAAGSGASRGLGLMGVLWGR